MKTRVALFGGSFDPPHRAHEFIPVFLLEKDLVDEVWYVPVKLHPFGKPISADADRLAMIDKVVKDLVKTYPQYRDKVKIETWEFSHNQQSYSIATLDGLAAKYPDHSFQFVIGTDNLEKFHLWQGADRILKEYGVYVYPRAGYVAEPLQSGMKYLADAPIIPVSSTEIRKQLELAQTTDDTKDTASTISPELVLPEVKTYALTHHLYLHGINK